MNNQQAIIASNRFGLGARRGEIKSAQSAPRDWLLQQLITPQFDLSLPDSATVIRQYHSFRAQKASAANRESASDNNQMAANDSRKNYFRFCYDNLSRAIGSTHSFSWRLLDFFSNHFSVTAQGGIMTSLAPTLEREAIAPNLQGSFAEMLVAVEQHPAMLVYLDNDKSIGPDSKQAVALRKRNKPGKGINENLAREILELHTLGINGGYQLDDIQELARAITGWSVNISGQSKDHGFLFRERTHQPGVRTILGKKYASSGVEQGEAILRDLAVHPYTARFISRKLARHILSDQPPEPLVAAMAKRWLQTGGNLQEVYTTLIQHPLSWETESRKLKTPREFLISVCRATDAYVTEKQSSQKQKRSQKRSQKREIKPNDRILINALTAMGQKPFGAGSPAGFADVSAAWDGANTLLTRIDWTYRKVTSMPGGVEPLLLAEEILGSQLSAHSQKVIGGAESRRQGLAMLFLSPEFIRR
ncbi:DUF1800 family protein [Endozoicomonas sp. ONNA2]|uniref:DUF1800 domain-containing protein n=1 Tax=Endozoicomonas sp. ONNA2 TaxID=2828741 RepID=UPI002148F2CE|nr:DUF1800 domain-containing protein [Endozoicomonas sp. ONNA2]